MDKPFNLEEAMSDARSSLTENRLHDVERICSLILSHRPKFPPAIFLLAHVEFRRGNIQQAIELSREVVNADPGAFPALEFLAKLLLSQGNMMEARMLGDQMMQLKPTDPSGSSVIGISCFENGNFAEALEWMQRAVSLAPKVSLFHYHLARIYEALKRIDEATLEYRRAIGLAPGIQAHYVAMGMMLYTHGRVQESLAPLLKAIDLAPSRNGFIQYAVALGELGRHSEAERYLREALLLDPTCAGAYEQLGSTLHILGRFVEAEGSFRRAIELDPELTGPYLRIVGAKKMTAADLPFISEIQKKATELRRTPDDLRKLNYVLGKAYADLDQYEQAMRHYDLANQFAFESQLKQVAFDRRHHRKYLNDQIDTFTAKFFHEKRNIGSNSDKPIFIIGMIRSGTTLTEQILSSHPRIGAVGEAPFWTEQERQGVLSKLIAGRLDSLELKSKASEYLEELGRLAPGFDRVTDKMPVNYLNLGLIHLVFPQAKIIHCRRSPIDTCLSIYMTPFENAIGFCYDRQSIVDGYFEYLRLMEHWRAVIPSEQFLEIDYEDLVADQEAVVRKMLSFCGLEWDPACLRHEENQRSVDTPSSWQVRQPVYRSSVQKWRRYEPWLREFRQLLPLEDQV